MWLTQDIVQVIIHEPDGIRLEKTAPKAPRRSTKVTNSEYNSLSEYGVSISSSDLVDQANRTLMLGYIGLGMVRHVYLLDRGIHVATFNHRDTDACVDVYGNQMELGPFSILHWYGETIIFEPRFCDFEFCKLLRLKGQYMRFSEYPPGYLRDCYGLEEFKPFHASIFTNKG